MNRRLLRLMAWPAVLVAVVLLALTQTSLGFEVNGNRNWLAFGPLTVQPSEIAKLSIILWAADVYAKKEKLLGNPWHALIPVAPVITMIAVLVVFQHDLGTALVLFAILLGMLWVVGVPARLFGIALSIVGVVAFYLAASNAERRTRLTSFIDPFKDFQGAGWQAGHGLLGMSSGGIFGKGLSASQQKWGNLPEAHTDFIFAVLGEELGLIGTLLVLALFARHRVRRHPARPQHHGPVRALRDGRCHHLVDVPDDHQHRHGAGAAAGDRHPAAARLLRRVGAGALAGGPRPARRLRARRARGRRRAAQPGRRRGAQGPGQRVPGRDLRRERPLEARLMDRSSAPRRVLLAGGGTAGHTSPLLATADALRRAVTGHRDHRARHVARAGDAGRSRRPGTPSSWSRRSRCPAVRTPTCCARPAGCGQPGRPRSR